MQSENFSVTRQNEWQAIRRVVTRARTRAYQGAAGTEIGKILDDVQDLMTLAGEPDQRPNAERESEFIALLRDVESRYAGFEGVSNYAAK